MERSSSEATSRLENSANRRLLLGHESSLPILPLTPTGPYTKPR
jgi:hypothetical protein